MTQIELSPFARRYMEELRSLVNTDRKAISFLRNLAAENHEQEKFHIVVALQQYLYHECPPEQQLPLLYLVDCILKTDTEHYLHTLCPPLPSMFRRVWQTSPKLHPALTKLANTWRPYLPPQTQAQIDKVTAAPARPSATPAFSAAPIARWTPPHPSLLQAGPAPASSLDPRLALSQPRPMQPQPQLQQPASMLPFPPTSTSLPLHPARTISPMPYAPLPSTGPVQLVVLNQLAAAPGGLAPAGVAPPLQPVGHTPAPMYHAPYQPAPSFQLPQQNMFSPHPTLQHSTLPQYMYGHQPLHQEPKPQAPSFPAPFPQPQPLPLPPQPLNQPPSSSSSRDIMAALHSLVSSMGAADAKAQAQAQAGSSGAAGSQQPGVRPTGKVPGSRSFHPSAIKEFDQSAVDALMDASSQTRTSFLDLRFLRTRRLRSAEQSGAPQCQPWYYPLDKWMQGVSAEEQEAAAEGLWRGEEEDEDAGAAAEVSVEQDPSQPECALSGEPFERWYDPDTDKWFYLGAVVLTGAAAARHGVMDGSIVKVHCLAGEPSRLGMAARGLGPGAAQNTGTAAPGDKQQEAAAAGLPVSKPRSPSPPAPEVAGAGAAESVGTGAGACGAVPSSGSSPAAEASAGSHAEAAAPQSPPASAEVHVASSPSATPPPASPSPTPALAPSWGAAPMEGCAVAALRLEPHVDETTQQQRSGEAGSKRGLALADGELSAPAALGGEQQAVKKIKLEFSQAV